MSSAAPDVRSLLDDERALLAWLVDLARATPDVYVRTPAGGITPSSHLRDELGIDSIGRVCVFYALADTIGTDADEAAASTWTTVGDVLGFIRASLGGR
jgi:acyl carrier protein